MIKVGVLRGGPSSEHEISLLSGGAVLSNLKEDRFQGVDIFIDKEGIWHVRGIPMSPEQALLGIDVAINVIHGQYGEDGTIQKILDRVGVPYSGAGVFASALSLNKPLTKEVLSREGVRMPRHRVLKVSPNLESEAREAFRAFSPPIIIKPASAGSSVGMKLAKTFDEFWDGVKSAFHHSREVMVEEYIKGKEATVGIVEGLRGEKYYKLLPIEIVPPKGIDFFDFENKYNGKTMERVPGNFTKSETAELQHMAEVAHKALNLRDYSRSDFIVSPRGVYFLESNSAAGVGLTKESLLPKALAAIGVSFEDFLEHVIESAKSHK